MVSASRRFRHGRLFLTSAPKISLGVSSAQYGVSTTRPYAVDWVLSSATDACGTCSMLPQDKGGVVDASLKVILSPRTE